MVIADGDTQTSQLPTGAVRAPRLARPLHRLAAVIVDVFVVLTPVYLVLAAPLKRALTTSVLTGTGLDSAFYSLTSGLLAVGLGVAYQTFAHHHYGYTVGKRLFRLRVVPAFGHVSLGAHLVRSLTWVATLALGGFPFLAVFADERRRPLHDRTGDTLVVTDVDGVDAPGEWPRALVRMTYIGATSCLLIAGLVGLHDVFRGEREAAAAALDVGACDVVTRYAAEGDDDPHARVRLGLTLYAAGLADRSCLEAEVEREVAAQTPVASETYLAQAFVNAEDAEVSNAYLDQVCADSPRSSECAMSHVVSQWSGEQWADVGRTLAAAPAGSGYLEVWGVRHFVKQAQYDQALLKLDQLMDRPEIADFTLDQRVRALYGAYRFDEARAAYKQAMVTLDPTVGRELSAWSCVQEFARGCGAVAETACARLGEDRESSGAGRLAQLRRAECHADVPVDYLELADAATEPSWRDFFAGSAKIQRADRAAAVHLLRGVVESDDATDLLRVEALRRLALIATPAQMRGLITRWNDFDSPAAWAQAGNMLVDRLALRGEGALARKVAQDLIDHQSLSPQSSNRLLTLDPAHLRSPASAE